MCSLYGWPAEGAPVLLSPRITSQMTCTAQQQPIFILQELLPFLHSRDVVSGSKCWRLCEGKKIIIILKAALSSQNPSSVSENKISQRIKLSLHLVAQINRSRECFCQQADARHAVCLSTLSRLRQTSPISNNLPLWSTAPLCSRKIPISPKNKEAGEGGKKSVRLR